MNDFSGDSDCVALWNLQPAGQHLVDSKGSHTLSENGTPEEVVDGGSPVGAGWVNLNRNSNEYLYINDGNLSLDFPLKSDTSNAIMSACLWFNSDLAVDDVTGRILYGKYNASALRRQFYAALYGATNKSVRFVFGSSNGTAYQIVEDVVTGIDPGQWYHLGFTFDGSSDSGSWKARLWNGSTEQDNSGTIDYAISTGSSMTEPVRMGFYTGASNYYDGNLVEIVVFKRELTLAEITQIRQGTYGTSQRTNFVMPFSGVISSPGA